MAQVVRRDVVAELEEARDAPRPGIANSDVNVFAIPIPVSSGVIDRAIKEIRSLRMRLVDEMCAAGEVHKKANHV